MNMIMRRKKQAQSLNLWWTVSQLLFSFYLARIVLMLDSYYGADKGGHFDNLTWAFRLKLPIQIRFNSDEYILASISLLAMGLFVPIYILGKYRAILKVLSYVQGLILVLGPYLVASLTWGAPSPMMLLESIVVATAIFGFQHWNRTNGMSFFVALSVFHFSVWVEYQWIFQFVNTATLLTWGYEMWLRRETPDDAPVASLAS